MAYNDLFGKEVKEYWKYEGNNKRMRTYYKIANKIHKVKMLLTICLLIYIAFLTTEVIVSLISGFDICSVGNCTEITKENMVESTMRMMPMLIIVIANLLFCLCLKGYIKAKNFNIYISVSIVIAPVLFLLAFGFKYGIISFTLFTIIFMLYVLISCLYNTIYSKIMELYNIATGKVEIIEENEDDETEDLLEEAELVTETKEVTEEVQVVKNEKYKKKRRK